MTLKKSILINFIAFTNKVATFKTLNDNEAANIFSILLDECIFLILPIFEYTILISKSDKVLSWKLLCSMPCHQCNIMITWIMLYDHTIKSHITESLRKPIHWSINCLFNSSFSSTMKKPSKLCFTGPLCRESTSHWWIPYTKDQYCRKCFHIMMSLCSIVLLDVHLC